MTTRPAKPQPATSNPGAALTQLQHRDRVAQLRRLANAPFSCTLRQAARRLSPPVSPAALHYWLVRHSATSVELEMVHALLRENGLRWTATHPEVVRERLLVVQESQRAGLSIAKTAARLGLHKSTLSRWLAAYVPFGVEEALADYDDPEDPDYPDYDPDYDPDVEDEPAPLPDPLDGQPADPDDYLTPSITIASPRRRVA